jgi:hypothetical protein
MVYSVGNGNDYVGSCINMAARLQKVPGVTFAFNRRGFDLEGLAEENPFIRNLIIVQMPIRGIGDRELVAILNSEYLSMAKADKQILKPVRIP